MQGMSPYMSPRYGAWSIDPYGAPNVMSTAINTAQNVANIQGALARNLAMQQQNELAKQTMPGLISAQNAQNQAQTQYAVPNMAANYQGILANNALTGARTGLTNAQAADTRSDIPVNQARTGLINAQAGYQNAQTDVTEGVQDPSASFNRLYQNYQNAPDGSFQKQYYGGLLNRMVNMSAAGYIGNAQPGQTAGAAPNSVGSPTYTASNGIITPKAAGTVGGGGSIINSVNGQPYNINAGSVSQRSLKGAQYSAPNPQDPNSTTTYESPTATAEGKEQVRQMAHGEIDSLGNVYNQGKLPYVGMGGLGNTIVDPLRAFFGDKDAIQRQQDLSLSEKIKPELAAAIGRYATGAEPGVESINLLMDKALGNDYLKNTSAAQSSLLSYLPAQTAAFNQSVLPERTGFGMNVPGKPNWLGSQNAPAPINLFTGDSKQDAANLAQLNNPQPANPAPQAPSGVQIPAVKSQAEFNNWYFSQPKEIRAQIRQQLGR